MSHISPVMPVPNNNKILIRTCDLCVNFSLEASRLHLNLVLTYKIIFDMDASTIITFANRDYSTAMLTNFSQAVVALTCTKTSSMKEY